MSWATQLKALAADDNVRIVVLRGAGKHFCTGADLQSRGPELQHRKPQPADVFAARRAGRARQPAKADDRSRAGRRARRRRGHGRPAATLPSPATARSSRSRNTGRDVGDGHHAVHDPRHGPSQFPPLWFVRRADPGGRGVTYRPRARGVRRPTSSTTTLARIADELLLGAPHAASALKAAAARHASPNLDEILAHVPPPHDPRSAEAQEGIASLPREAQAELVSGVTISGNAVVNLEASKKKVEALTAPRNAVLVGASDRPGSWAARVWRNLHKYEFPGPVYSINPRRTEIWDKPCYPDFKSLPEAARPPGGAGAGRGRERSACAQARPPAHAAPPCSPRASAKPSTPRPPRSAASLPP